MTDIVLRLRLLADCADRANATAMNAAADEIERLQAELATAALKAQAIDLKSEASLQSVLADPRHAAREIAVLRAALTAARREERERCAEDLVERAAAIERSPTASMGDMHRALELRIAVVSIRAMGDGGGERV